MSHLVDDRTVPTTILPDRPIELPRLTAPSPIPLDPPLHPGDVGSIDGIRLLRLIGKGSTAAVFEVFDVGLDRKAAMKILLPTVGHRKVRERFLREARLCAKIYNDHVVTIYRTGEVRGLPFIEMELMAGVSLEQYLRKSPVCKANQIVRFAKELLDGLAAVHGLGIVHRDIKPGNIWLAAPHGKAKLLDFGLAHIDDASTSQLTQLGAILGTPAYMSPEQARGRAVNARSDLFGVGVVLYQMATGALPFVGRTPLDVIAAITQHKHQPARLLNSSISQALSDLIDRLLEKDSTKRPASALEAITLIKAIPTSSNGMASGSSEHPAVVIPSPPIGPALSSGPQAHVETKEQFVTLNDTIVKLNPIPPARKDGLTTFAMVLMVVFFLVSAGAILYFRFR